MDALIITRPDFTPVFATDDYTLDLAYGNSENNFELTVDDPSAPKLTGGEYVYIDGSPYGGRVDSIEHNTQTNTTTYRGRSFFGLLEYAIIEPPRGVDYRELTTTLPISSVLMYSMRYAGLLGNASFWKPSNASSDVQVKPFKYDRYTTFLQAFTKLARTYSFTFEVIPRSTNNKHNLYIQLYNVNTITDVDSDLIDFKCEKYTSNVNHLICLGRGELKNREVIHLYADHAGNISKIKTIKAPDEVTAVYDYSNVEDGKLEEEGIKHLKELQGAGSVRLSINNDKARQSYHIGDIVQARDQISGLYVTASIVKKIVKVESGVLSVEYEVGNAQYLQRPAQDTKEQTQQAPAYAQPYTAGAGIAITDHTITAEVTRANLDTVTQDTRALAQQVHALTDDLQTLTGTVARLESSQPAPFSFLDAYPIGSLFYSAKPMNMSLYGGRWTEHKNEHAFVYERIS